MILQLGTWNKGPSNAILATFNLGVATGIEPDTSKWAVKKGYYFNFKTSQRRARCCSCNVETCNSLFEVSTPSGVDVDIRDKELLVSIHCFDKRDYELRSLADPFKNIYQPQEFGSIRKKSVSRRIYSISDKFWKFIWGWWLPLNFKNCSRLRL